MNAEQASKQANAEADPPLPRGRPKAGREESDACTDLLPPGYWRQHAWNMKKAATREALHDAAHAATGTPRGNGLRLSAAVDPKIFLAVSAARFFSQAKFFVCFRNFEKKSLDMLPRIGMIAFDRFGASAWIQTSQSCQ